MRLRSHLPFRSHGGLVALTTGLPLAEGLVLRWSGMAAAQPLAPQITAPEPFGIFHDLRWVSVFHDAWWSFALELLLLVAFRAGLMTLLVRLAWPGDRPRPPLRPMLIHNAIFTAAVLVLLTPSEALIFASAAAPVSWIFLAAWPLALLVAVLVFPGPVRHDWWRWRAPARSVGWVFLTFVVLTAGGALVASSPPGLAELAIVATGLFDAWAWVRIVRGLIEPGASAIRLPQPSISLALMAAVVLGMTALTFGLLRDVSRLNQSASRPASRSGRPVLLVTGFGSSWSGRPDPLLGSDFDQRRFSYAGMGPNLDPLPFGPQATQRPLPVLVREMARQVRAFAEQTGQQVSIVAESEGTVVAKTYLATHPGAPVSRLIMLSPLVDPGRVYFPPPGREGWGVASGWEVRGISAVIRWLSSLQVAPDVPFFRDLVNEAPALQRILRCPLAGVRQIAFEPLADAVTGLPPTEGSGAVPRVVIPAFHGGMLESASVQRSVDVVLSGGTLPSFRAWEVLDRAVRAVASPWQSPSLPATLPTAWDHTRLPDPVCAPVGST
ncbi:MAG TPA: alpha/beta hydrolase [Actinomycetota bacterium]|nr:alpha/beta hydrolase [Actinomycetota bacterium]